MNPATESWVGVAEIDFETAILAAGAPRRISESVCYHAQQCVEKYLKAILQEQGRDVPRTHELAYLLDLVHEAVPELMPLRSKIQDLSSYAMVFRYPHDPLDVDDLSELADEALHLMVKTRQVVRTFLDIRPPPA